MCFASKSVQKGGKLYDQNIINYFFGGDAIFTLENTTGTSVATNHITFMVQSSKNKSARRRAKNNGIDLSLKAEFFFIKVLGAGNQWNSLNVGFAVEGDRFVFKTKRTGEELDEKAVKTMQWLMRRMWLFEVGQVTSVLPDGMDFWHNGTCSMCGLSLTDPLSCEVGIGPICRKRLGLGGEIIKERARRKKINKLLATK